MTLKQAAEPTEARKRSWVKYNRKRYASDPKAASKRTLEWQKANKEKVNKKNRTWHGKTPLRRRAYSLKANYGMTLEEWDLMFASQGSICAICSTSEPGASHGWHTDHIHGTKIVRGILCHQCNTMLGRAKDDPEILLKGVEYLRKARVP